MSRKQTSAVLAALFTMLIMVAGCGKSDLDLPKVTTGDISNINAYSALVSGNVVDAGATPLVSRGICYSTKSMPTVSGLHTENGNAVGFFNSAVGNLSPNTTYYVRAYATNADGTGYGEQQSFKTTAP